MSNLISRFCSLLVGGTRIDGLRVTFSIEKKDAREANKAVITVTNLSTATRAKFDEKSLPVVVEAGYVDRRGAVFIGTAYRTTHTRSGADVVTTIEAADGGREISTAVGAWSYAAGVSSSQVIRDVADGISLPLSTGSSITPNKPTFGKGWAFVGSAADALSAATKAVGLTWSVQDGQIQILADADDGTAVTVLSATTGMIGSPERLETKADGKDVARVKVSCLLQPQIRPARRIKIESINAPGLSGVYVVKEMKLTGDTHGNDWTMAIEAQKA